MSGGEGRDIQSCDIRIDKEGVWFYRGAEMFRREIVNLFYQNLRRDKDGRFVIELGGERCYVEVEDTPFVVNSVYASDPGQERDETILLEMCDGTVEKLDPATLRVGRDNVMYCAVRGGEYVARFSRSGYYQLANHIDYEPETDRYFIKLNGRSYTIDTRPEGKEMEGGDYVR